MNCSRTAVLMRVFAVIFITLINLCTMECGINRLHFPPTNGIVKPSSRRVQQPVQSPVRVFGSSIELLSRFIRGFREDMLPGVSREISLSRNYIMSAKTSLEMAANALDVCRLHGASILIAAATVRILYIWTFFKYTFFNYIASLVSYSS